VTTLPRARQRAPSEAPENSQAIAQENLTRAFVTFTQAASSLERSYSQLQAEVMRLHAELQRTSSELEQSLEENARVRGYLSRVLEKLPCGVLVAGGNGKVEIINPQARKLLALSDDCKPDLTSGLPRAFLQMAERMAGDERFSEQEYSMDGKPGNRTIGISVANISEKAWGDGDVVWILRDVTEQKRIAAEREGARKSHALAEVAAVLAHEIRNPLGSLELFTGLMADATAHMPETRQWVMHLQAGLRSLSATMTNVVDVYINYLRRKLDTGASHPLIRTIRGVGYQIGGNGQLPA
jgi:nitrogen fixation/metabolism regulation signal transduction histidine kinase